MNELTPLTLAKPLDKSLMADDSASLNALCGFLNNPAVTGAEAPPKSSGVSPVVVAPVVTTPAPAQTKNLSKVFYTGRLCAGKDYVASLTGATIFGFADPLYAMANYFFGTKVTSNSGKDVNGIRSFLQTVGQWGWGCTEEQYPLTPARASFIRMIRDIGGKVFDGSLCVDWDSFGRNPTIWIDAALRRIEAFQKENPDARVATTNARFEREFNALRAAGWTHMHVMTSANTWKERLSQRKLKPDSPVLKDVSEKLAAHLDNDVTIKISKQRAGTRLNCIWNDTTTPPSPRLWTVKQLLSAAEVSPVEPMVITGE